ncbi:MAG: hydrogenase expression/formation protein HypE [Deltaproteobacteria bacterium]|jgi:hydrogenase expression/formation protein HypE|nr:hydrogenase expression/formation protein HypE [Deltaproteobacteria bacterium]
MPENTKILLDEGSGGEASQRLLGELFFRHFGLAAAEMDDAALLYGDGEPSYGLAVSTDSFTVEPLEFPGGDIGCLAVYGSVNDVAMLGARPEFLSCAFIMEEGLERELLERLVVSMAGAAKRAGVRIVTGDTKVVPRGAADRLFINTTAIGRVLTADPPRGKKARGGDAVLVSGSLGEHGLTIMAARESLGLSSELRSDCAPLHHMTQALLRELAAVHVLRDPTRGGLAATLHEIAGQSGVVCELEEKDIPIRAAVRDVSAMLGLDPLYLANEGKLVCVLPEDLAGRALEIMRGFPEGAGAARIGLITDAEKSGSRAGQVILRTPLGGRRLLARPEGAQLPRIC